MDALTFLRQDHKSVLGMLEVLDGAPSKKGSQVSGLETMVTNLVIAESQHEAIEEQFFWPAVRRALEDGDALADTAIAQEQEGKRLLQQLEDTRPGQPEYQRALQAFVAAAREHIAFEQETVWPKFQAAVGSEELETIGRRLETAKKVAPTRPHPNTPPSAMLLKTLGMVTAVVDHLRDALSGRAAKNPPDPQIH
ncbi:hemerythrin domain-containing protein [Mycobacterium parmense]|uniref:Hemerythrin n=1 Tax=Mycobacterium parmense TaxID=185642 RepID=A0A7I7YRH4_9MYCO|nr:hemerythrin domain-containing protein [Mycobacterium parmense]MCV7348799.1 hemerythrin domain-containing protein [Mycobacterium parmense]ORW49663.1 hemerythrin [Mycobacterium parmense]BBZ44309.1 hemerythrin [Mycobacterium parmense]